MKRTLFISVTIFSVFIGVVLPVFAQSLTEAPWQERAQEKRKAIQEKKLDRLERRCDIVTSRIDARINRYKEHNDDVEARMSRITERTNDFISRLESKGYDVSTVRTDLQTLEEMRNTRRSLYTAFISELEQTKQFDCGSSEGAFKTALGEGRTALILWRDQIKANREFIRTTLRPDLQALKEQKPDSSVTE